MAPCQLFGAGTNTADNYYNVHGSVGSRIAMQLQKGDRIRIGVNGHILSHDLKVKKWTKDEGEDDQDKGNEKLGDDGEKEQEEQDEKEDPHNPALTNGEDQTTLADFDFGELVYVPRSLCAFIVCNRSSLRFYLDR